MILHTFPLSTDTLTTVLAVAAVVMADTSVSAGIGGV